MSQYVDKIYGYEPDPTRLRRRAAELAIEPVDIERIMADPSVGLVCIASPNSVHVEQAVMALRAGKAVICEKPMGTTLDEARQMIEAERETGNFLQIGFECHYSRIYRQVKEWIDAGLIGTPLNCHCRYYCSEFHKKNNWRSNSRGSFLIGEKLSHYLDLQRWWLDSTAATVYSCHASNAVDYFNHPDNHQIITKFKNGGVGSLNFVMHLGESYQTDPLREMLEQQADDGHCLQCHVFGDKGAIETDVFRRRIRRWEFSDSPTQLVSKIAESISFTKEDDNLWFHNTSGQNMRIIELIANGDEPEMPASEAYETMRICFAAELSEQEERIVDLPKECF